MARIVVVGAGVIGLTTAIALQERGHRVSVWTRDDPLATTSAVAAAIWLPFLAEPRQRVLGWAAATFAALQSQAAEPAAGVRMTTLLQVFAVDEPDLWWLPAAPGAERLRAAEVPAPFRAAVQVPVPLCDTSRYLPWLLTRFAGGGGALHRRTARSLREVAQHADLVVNCSGLGARELCGDTDLHAVRGQVLKLHGVTVPHALVDDTGAQPCYVLPRIGDVVVGGTAQRGDERLGVDPADSVRILDTAARHLPQLRSGRVEATAVGLRPCRSCVRLEAERLPGIGNVVHNYGHGGSGFTLAWGCAADVVTLAAPPGVG